MLYAAKCYWPDVGQRELEQVADRAARSATAVEISDVAYLGSLLFAADDLVLCLFEARSRAAVKRERAAWDSVRARHGDHNGFGTTNPDLVKCAKALFMMPVTYSATLDGHAVNLHALLASTGEFFVPKVVGQSAPTARSAAYGPGILLRGLSKGTHAIQSATNIPGVEKVNSTVKVHVG